MLVRPFVRCSSSLARLLGDHIVLTEQSSRPRDRVQFHGRDVALPIEQQWGNVSAEGPGQQRER